eukprot:3726443-Alexandrium_andersonii.AAC.1
MCRQIGLTHCRSYDGKASMTERSPTIGRNAPIHMYRHMLGGGVSSNIMLQMLKLIQRIGLLTAGREGAWMLGGWCRQTPSEAKQA